MSALTFDSHITSTPGPPRKSMAGSRNNPNLRQSLFRKTLNREEASNDDDAERSSLVASERVASSTPRSTGTSTDHSISLTPQKEHYQGCLKLYAENKITKDNAWNLQLIDFMTTMLRRHDQRMENLQTASTMVDASTKIYSFRVDAVHHDVLLMAGGLTKAVHTKRGRKDDENADEGGSGATPGDAPPLASKKKKRMKGATAPNPEAFAGDFETNLCIDPFFERLAATTGDVTSSNRAFNATLPIHDETLALILRTDIQFLEAVKENLPEDVELLDRVTFPSKLVPAFTQHEHICLPFTGFSITHWDPDTEHSERRMGAGAGAGEALNLSQQALAFDVEADVEPIPAEEPLNDLYEEEPLGGIESEEEGDVAVAACVARAGAGAGGAAGGAHARLTDMRPAGAGDARFEYTYCGASVLSAWAGPSHWRLKHNRASRMCERTSSPGGAGGAGGGKPAAAAARARARRQVEYVGAGLAWGARAPPPDYEPAPPAKIMISRKTLATGPAWNQDNYRTPVDRGLDESFFRKLFLRRNVVLVRKRDSEPSKEPDHLTVEEARDYDYNNENDASYCPLNMQEGEQWGNDDGAAAGELHSQAQAQAPCASPRPEDIGEMIEPPTKVAKIFIPYAMRAKKVDMKQLKHIAWKCLAGGGEAGRGRGEVVEPTSFFSVYAALGGALAGEARDSLSVPLALLAVLHLANEKGLLLEQRDDHKDIAILGLIK